MSKALIPNEDNDTWKYESHKANLKTHNALNTIPTNGALILKEEF